MSLFENAIPVVRVDDIAEAEVFYCHQLGFTKLFENAPGKDRNPAYIGLSREGVRIDVSSFAGDGVMGAALRFDVGDVDVLYEELIKRDVDIKLEPFDQSWGTREMLVDDPFGNKLRFSSD